MLILSIKNTMIIIKLSSKIKHITENQYKNIIQSLNFDELSCPKCNSKGLRVHASYSRYVDFFKRSHKITIQRLRCPECGSTHAVLIEDMIPYSIASYDLIVDVLVGIDFLVSSFRVTIPSTPFLVKNALCTTQIFHKAFYMTLRRPYSGQVCKILWVYIIR